MGLNVVVDIRIGHLNILDHLLLAPLDGLQSICDVPDVDIFDHIYLQPLNAWDQIMAGLESGDINAAFTSIPLAMAMFSRIPDIVLVMFAHRGGSRMVAGRGIRRIQELKGKTVLVPHKLSIQNMLLHQFLNANGLICAKEHDKQQISTEAVPLFLLPEITSRDSANDIGAFICEDPIAATVIHENGARSLLNTNDLWLNHPSSAFAVHRQVLNDKPAMLQDLVTLFFHRATCLNTVLGSLPPLNPAIVQVAADFTGQPEPVVLNALTESGITFAPKLLIPDIDLMEIIAQYMCGTMKLLPAPVNLEAFIDINFARQAVACCGI